ncbi:phosphoribosylglycinamide synthetase C domain-containing protein, partial [Aeromonas taiwanensis]|uniref:phosphoribosylglycinamide synthetase C domain-containing protein n=1 Tax=Aeromonas taiwanensis TaxID=633417 RepID=UPI003BA37F7F
ICFVANFLDTLGVGSFAVKTACYKQFRLIDDRVLPGTLNGQCVLPTVTQALIFIGVVNVDPVTLISMMAAAAAGAAWGARYVASFDRQTIRLVMAVSLLVVAGLIFAGLLGLFPLGGEAMGLSGYKLGIALAGNFLFGALMNVGIGLFAPCMTLVYLLGMNPLVAFPIMMGSTAVLSVFSAGTFIRKGTFDARAVLAVAIFGPIGVVLAAGGYPGDYTSNHPISGLPVDEVAGEKVFHAGTRLEGHTSLTQGGRVLCATALGHTVQEAQQRAYALAGRIQWDGIFYRKDIGWRAIEREQAE